ncbi:MAG: phosphatidate cytidylyltransferase [Burkholderiales bacterium]|nr:phosphatidate cytidylyltransferase [Burkholderiales bacterium]
MLKQRVITALVLLAVLLAAFALGRTAFDLLAAALIGAAAFEWLRLAGLADRLAAALAMVYAALLLILELSGRTPSGPVITLIVAGACAVWATLFVTLLQAELGGVRVGRTVSIALCFALLTAAWFALLYLYGRGIVALLSVLAVVWLADVSAYFAGRAFGKRKLAPSISPGKTWAGVYGAVLGVVAVAALAHWAWPSAPLFTNQLFATLNVALVVALLCMLVAVSIVGDLFESLMKRQAGLKDSGGLLPGHGGVLDRIDALLPVLPAAVLIQRWLT